MKRYNLKPPRLAAWLLKQMTRYQDSYYITSDLEEVFYAVREDKGFLAAFFWYWYQCIAGCLRYFELSLKWSVIMFSNYLKIALRNIKKQKVFSFINIIGLAVGLACCILMFLWINDELSFDKYHENYNELYRITTKIPTSNEVTMTARTANAVGPALVEQYPDFVNYTRYQVFEGTMVEANGISVLNNHFGVADPSFFEMFSFTFLKGDPATVFKDKFSIVLTESLAKKYFGSEDPMGKTMYVQMGRTPFLVTGVIKDMPETSHLHFECMMPFIVCKDWYHANPEGWSVQMYYTYIQLLKGSKAEDLNKKISGIIKKHDKTSLAEISLMPLRDIHLRSNLTADMDNYKKGDIKYIYIYFITAISILIIACINFMNLSTARSGRRAKEVGLRKVMGAQKNHLLRQFLGESILLSVFALFLAVILVIILLPPFNNLTSKKLVFDFSLNLKLITGIAGITLITGVIAGIYPAFFLSALKPVKALKNSGFRSGRGGLFLRKLLVISQFVFSVILISGTIIVYDQMDFMKNKPLGYDNRNIINTSGYFFARSNSFLKEELLNHPNILSISTAMIPTMDLRGNSSFTWEGKISGQEITLYPAPVDYSYLETFGMSMKDGRFFSREFGSNEDKIVINETAAKIMGLKNPIGKKVSFQSLNFGTGRYDDKECIIIGIMNDFHQRSLHNPIEPMVFEFISDGPWVSIKVKPDNISETLAFLEDTWKTNVDYPYSYSFLAEKVNKFYINDKKTGAVFSYFSLLAIFISCLGLFGLASYTSEQRKKEKNNRKVVGSSITGITLLLSREFLKSVVISLIIACPLAWFIMNNWLNSYAYRIDIGISTFLFAGFIATLTAISSIYFQIFKAARANPVDILRNE